MEEVVLRVMKPMMVGAKALGQDYEDITFNACMFLNAYATFTLERRYSENCNIRDQTAH